MEEKKNFLRVSPETFAAFLKAKNSSQSCISCGSSHLFVPRVDNARHTPRLYVTYYKIQESEPASTANCEYRVICTHCGFTSYYWAFIVELWLEADLFPVELREGKE